MIYEVAYSIQNIIFLKWLHATLRQRAEDREFAWEATDSDPQCEHLWRAAINGAVCRTSKDWLGIAGQSREEGGAVEKT